jgi:hypothetical protein
MAEQFAIPFFKLLCGNKQRFNCTGQNGRMDVAADVDGQGSSRS